MLHDIVFVLKSYIARLSSFLSAASFEIVFSHLKASDTGV